MAQRTDFDWNESPPTPEEAAAESHRLELLQSKAQRRSEIARDLVASKRVWLLMAALTPVATTLAFTLMPVLYRDWDPSVLWFAALGGTGYGIAVLAKLGAHVRTHARNDIASQVGRDDGDLISLTHVVSWAGYTAIAVGMAIYLGWSTIQGQL